ncbi:MAG: hypothetical protein K9K79_06205 [Desulfohalobiaceae bacterium]|nr:hypothetical protein [Desulfohalobiaceae bacterium]
MTKGRENKQADILDELFQENENQDDDPRLTELLQFIENMGESFCIPENEAKTSRKKQGRKGKPKKRSSSYLSPENFKALDQAKAECRRLLKKHRENMISKSRITEISLEIMLKDFEINKEKSLLAQKLRKNKPDGEKG